MRRFERGPSAVVNFGIGHSENCTLRKIVTPLKLVTSKSSLPKSPPEVIPIFELTDLYYEKAKTFHLKHIAQRLPEGLIEKEFKILN